MLIAGVFKANKLVLYSKMLYVVGMGVSKSLLSSMYRVMILFYNKTRNNKFVFMYTRTQTHIKDVKIFTSQYSEHTKYLN